MSSKLKILLTLIITCVVLIIGYFIIQQFNENTYTTLLNHERKTREVLDSLPLNSIDGKSVAILVASKDREIERQIQKMGTYLFLFFFVFSVSVILIFLFSYNKFVMAPMRNIIKALNTHKPAAIDKYKDRKDEFGVITNLIFDFYRQKSELCEEVAEHMKTESYYRKSEKRFKDFSDLLPGIVFEINIEGNITFANQTAFDVFGFSIEDYQNCISLFSLFPKEELVRVKENFQKRIVGEISGGIQYTAKKRNGALFLCLVYANTIFENEIPVGLRAVMIDMTEHRFAEGRIIQLMKAVDQIQSAIMITDKFGNIEFTNPYFTVLTGYSADEVLGKNPKIMKSGKMHESLYKELWATIKSGGIWRGEFINRRKNDDLYWEYQTISSVRDKNGDIINYISVKENINEQKVMEKKLHEVYESINLQNNELNQQKEEILAQRGEIEAQRDTLQKQMDITTRQRDEITQINTDLTDSIKYALRIQNAVLPQKIFMEALFSEHFVLYKPKNIVSGDFYWVKSIEDKIVVGVIDCTGHGVPGALMSMLAITFLNEIVKLHYNHSPAIILNNFREYIIHSLNQSGMTFSANDGMDMSLCIIDTKEQSLQFSGANNPLYIATEILPENMSEIGTYINIDEAGNKKFLCEIAPDKMPVGYFVKMTPFTNHEIKYHKNDIFYLVSDGFEDQMGGPKGKKFLSKQLKDLLKLNTQKPLVEQHESISNAFNNWIHVADVDYEQTDDVTVFGFKL